MSALGESREFDTSRVASAYRLLLSFFLTGLVGSTAAFVVTAAIAYPVFGGLVFGLGWAFVFVNTKVHRA